MRDLFGIFCLVFCMTGTSVWCFSGADVDDVITKLFTTDGYNKKVRPLLDQTGVVTVTIDFHLSSIVDFQEKEESLKTSGYLFCSWTDQYLLWNTSTYNGVDYIFLPQDDIWKPDLALSNAFKTFTGLGSEYLNVKVSNDGIVEWYPFQILQSTCSLDITYFPFDIQECKLQFTAWSYVNTEVNINVGSNGMILDRYSKNAAWTLHSTTYEDVETGDAAVIFVVRLKRKPSFYMINVLLPVILLSILNCFSFCLPCASGERASYAITVFLSMAVFLTIVASEMPQNSDKVSLVSVYLSLMSGLSTFIVVISTVELRLDVRTTDKHPINVCFKAFMKFYAYLRCKSCKKNTVESLPEKEKSKLSSCDLIMGVEPEYTWKEIVNAMDFCLFWCTILFTFVCTVVIFSICGTHTKDVSGDKNSVQFNDYY